MQKHLKPKSRRWRIELTEEQLRVMIKALEDWHRFISGQCSMGYATSFIPEPKAMHTVREILDRDVKAVMFPELGYGHSYSWCGGQPNPYMSEAAAITYLLYREARHQLTLASEPKCWDVYKSETLACAAQGPMIKVELIK